MPGNDAYTVLLLPCDGTDTSQVFPDTSVGGSTHIITANNTAQVDTEFKKFGTGSYWSDGGDDFLSTLASADFDFGTNDFTIDFWVRFTSTATSDKFMGQYENENYNWEYVIYENKFHLIWKSVDGTVRGNYYSTDAWSRETVTWYHLEFCRDGITAHMFIDGTEHTLTETLAFGTNDTGATNRDLSIGAGNTGSDSIDGHLDEIRISKGIARHTSDFSVPTEEYGEVVDILKILGIAQADISKVSGVALASISKVAGVSNV